MPSACRAPQAGGPVRPSTAATAVEALLGSGRAHRLVADFTPGTEL
ncbi:hypothetical protein [Streptomyces sp. NPDC093260]